MTASDWTATFTDGSGDGVSDEQMVEILEYAPPDLVQAWLLAVLHHQQAANDLERYLALKERMRCWRLIEDYLPVRIRLSDGRLMSMVGNSRVPVPRTRAECPVQRPCGFVRCRYHLWRVDGGEDGTRAGRPGLSAVPRNERGLTQRVLGELAGERPGTTLEARWLETPVPPSCALDEADKGPHSNEEVGYCVNRHRTLAARDTKRASEHGTEKAEAMGISRDDFLAGLRANGAGR